MTTEPFTLELPAVPSRLHVAVATGSEAMNALYRFDVEAIVTAEHGFARRAVETPATLAMISEGSPVREVHGIVAACQASGQERDGRPRYRLRIVPRMARLAMRRSSRIFQDLTTREIVEHVLGISDVPNRWELAGRLPRRAYCVQHDETDLAFVARICAADGIFFSFEHPLDGPGAAEIVVFSDTADAYAPVDGPTDLRYRPVGPEGSSLILEEDHVQSFLVRHEMKTKRVLFRRYDFERPPIPRRDAAGLDTTPALDLETPLQQLESMRAFVDHGAAVYEHQNTREQALLDPIAARTGLEAERAEAVTVEAETIGRRLVPGRRFRLVEHALPELDGEYVVTSCDHECRSPAWAMEGKPVYRNGFTAVPASVPYRAERPARKVRQSLETATVVGPEGEEIYTDEYGRIKVQFHWDLQGKFDDRSSAWLRVVQAWAGTGYGAQFLPRIGHEVLVGYVDGDADRPIVLGSLHNGVNQTPFTFPRDKTQSGIKTWTSPDGQGGHELIFEDKAGSEMVSLRSVKTMALVAAENSTLSADCDLRIATGRDRTDEVLGDASVTIVANEQRTTGGHRRTSVGRDDLLEVGGRREADIAGDDVARVKGMALNLVSRSRTTVIGADTQEPGSDQLGVSGRYSVASVEEMHLESQRKVTIACGKSKITLLPDSVVIDSPTIQLQATDRIALLQGGGASLLTLEGGAAAMGGGTASVFGGGKPPSPPARLFLDTNAHLDGKLVLLNCGPMGGGSGAPIGDKDEKGIVTFTVLPGGLPPEVKSVTLVIATPTGEIVERPCEVGGTVTMEGRKGEVFTVVETRVGDISVPVQKKEANEVR